MWRVWGRGEACTGFSWGNLKERDHLEDPGVNGRKNVSLGIGMWGVDWIDLAHDGNRWWVLVNAVMNLQVP
jgi:hypothetical protein